MPPAVQPDGVRVEALRLAVDFSKAAGVSGKTAITDVASSFERFLRGEQAGA